MEKIIVEIKDIREKQIKTESNIENIDKNLTTLSTEFKDIMKLLNQNLVVSEKIKNIEEDLKENKQIGKEAVISIRKELSEIKETKITKEALNPINEELKEIRETNSKYKFAFISFSLTLTAAIIVMFLKMSIEK